MTGVIAHMAGHGELILAIIQYSQHTFLILSYCHFAGQGI